MQDGGHHLIEHQQNIIDVVQRPILTPQVLVLWNFVFALQIPKQE